MKLTEHLITDHNQGPAKCRAQVESAILNIVNGRQDAAGYLRMLLNSAAIAGMEDSGDELRCLVLARLMRMPRGVHSSAYKHAAWQVSQAHKRYLATGHIYAPWLYG